MQALRDQLLEALVSALGPRRGKEAPASSRDAAARYAADRHAKGFELTELIAELGRVHDSILDARFREARVDGKEIRDLRAAMEEVIIAAVEYYAREREKTLRSLDRIATASLESSTIDDLLQRLLRVFTESAPSIDTAAILLVEGDELRMRASTGLEGHIEPDLTIPIGKGFAGTIAATRRPMEVEEAHRHPLIISHAFRKSRVRAMYGLPMLEGDTLLGVADMGSRSARRFSDHERRLFGLLVARATAGIHQHMLRERAERSHALVDALIDASPVGVALIDHRHRYVRINRALAQMNGRPIEAHLGRSIHEVVPPESRDEVESLLAEVVRSDSPRENLRTHVSTPQGSRTFLSTLFRVPSGGREPPGVGAFITEITEAVTREEELRRANEEFRLLVENIDDYAIWTLDRAGHVSTWNPGAERMTGYGADEVIGRHFEILDEPLKLAERESRYVEEVLRSRKDGSAYWAQLTLTALHDDHAVRGFAAITRDTTEYHRMLDEARVRAAELEAVIESIPEAVYIGDERGLRMVNTEAARQLGFQRSADLIRSPAKISSEIVPRDPVTLEIIPIEEQVFWRALHGESSARDVLVRHVAGGTDRLIRTSAAPVKLGDRIIAAVAINVDLTERKRMEDVLRHNEKTAREAVRSRDNILAIVSHDLRNPLNAISLSAALLLRDARIDERGRRLRHQVDRIQRASSRMNRLIQDLVDFASIQEGRLRVVPAEHDAGDLIAGMIESVLPEAIERGLTIEQTIDRRGSLVVWVDRERIEQVLSNLVQNAMNATPSGGRITVSAERVEDQVRIAVADTGPGLPEQDLERVFQRAWRGEAVKHKGTGLGLTIARGIVEAHGGRIWAENRPGLGAKLSFVLPGK